MVFSFGPFQHRREGFPAYFVSFGYMVDGKPSRPIVNGVCKGPKAAKSPGCYTHSVQRVSDTCL